MQDEEYKAFLKKKGVLATPIGKDIDPSLISPVLFPFQKDVVLWALRKGRCAMFLDTGLGKTVAQVEWARLMGEVTLIIAPLSVARQTVRIAKEKLDIDVKYIRHGDEMDSRQRLYITNYEMIEHFDASQFGAVVLDESSILKGLASVTRKTLIKMFKETPYKLCCTATPAPNDEPEIGNHAEFLGVATMKQMLGMFFVNANKVKESFVGDGRVVTTKQSGKKGQEWRLKNHAREAFYKWLSSWSISIRKPSDLGYDDNGFVLPPLNIQPIFVDVDYVPEGQLFFTKLHGIQDRSAIRKNTMDKRVKRAAELVNNSDEQWLLWAGLVSEGDELKAAIPGAAQVKGSDDYEYKIKTIEAFQDGKEKTLISKARITGFGMNFQNAHNMIFVGLGDSWEMYYQCIRREYRFGQKKPVNVYVILSEIEREIWENVMRKEAMAKRMTDELISRIKQYELEELQNTADKEEKDRPDKEMNVPVWLYQNVEKGEIVNG